MLVRLFVTLFICASAVAADSPAARSAISLQTGPSLTAPVAADFNGDGRLDLAVIGPTNISIYPGLGGGTFGEPVVTPLDTTETRRLYRAALVEDFNGDRKQDLVAFGRIFLGNGDGSLRYAGSTPITHHLQAGDWEGDGKLDLVGYTASGSYGLALGESLAHILVEFNTPAYATAEFNYGDYDAPYSSHFRMTGEWPDASVPTDYLGDLGGIGSPVDYCDYSCFAGTGGIQIYRLNGSIFLNGGGVIPAGFMVTHSIPVPAGVLRAVAQADMDGDGRWDIIITYSDGPTAVIGYYPNLGGLYGSFQIMDSFPTMDQAVSLTLGDFNGDYKLDVATHDGSSFRLYPSVPMALSSASLRPGSLIARGSLATLYMGIPGQETAAANLALPLTAYLGDLVLWVKDSKGEERAADLVYVSSTQINFVVPPDTVPGEATITIDASSGQFLARASIKDVAPGFFAQDSQALGYALRIEPNGSSTVLSLLEPLNLDNRPVYLVLYGTGARNRISPAEVEIVFYQYLSSLRILATPAYAGPDGSGIPGLDQVNILLPASLKGRGLMYVTFNKFTTNSVILNNR